MKVLPSLGWLAVPLMMMSGCSDRTEVVAHPIIEARPEASRISGPEQKHAILGELQVRLSSIKRHTEIGTMAGSPETVFGRPTDIAVTTEGELLILDAMASEIRAFDGRGQYLRTLATKGPGPLELLNPVSIDLLAPRATGNADARQRLVVGTRTLVKLFDFAEDGALELERTYAPRAIPLPNDVCVASDKVVVRSSLSSRADLLVSIDPVNDSMATFGTGYEHGGAIAREDLSLGPTACLPNGDVVVAFTYLPWVASYDKQGSLRWVTKLPDFMPVAFQENKGPDGYVTFSRSFKTAGDMVLGIQHVPGGSILVQVARLNPATPERPTAQKIQRRSTYILSAESGEGAFLTDSLPALLAVTNRTLWTVEEAPAGFPRIVGFDY